MSKTINSKFCNNIIYQNYNRQSNVNPDKSSSLLKSTLNGFNSSNISGPHLTSRKDDKTNLNIKSLSSTLLSNNVNTKKDFLF